MHVFDFAKKLSILDGLVFFYLEQLRLPLSFVCICLQLSLLSAVLR